MTQPAPATAAPRRFQLPNLSTLGPLIALLIAVIVFSTQSPRFLSGTNFSLILQQISYTAVLAIGQTLIILIAGIDLSIGIVMALGGLVMAKLATQSGVSPVLAILAGFATTMFFGFLNSQIITRLRVPPFIATLGMMMLLKGLSLVISGTKPIYFNDTPDFSYISQESLIGYHLRHGADAPSVPDRLVRAERDCAWPPRVCGGQQPRGRPPERHSH